MIAQKETEIGHIGINETIQGKIVLSVPRYVQLPKLDIELKVSEEERQAALREKTFALSGGTMRRRILYVLQ